MSCADTTTPVARVTAAMAKGKHPVPSRTRKLSLSAPMVLQPGGCGRVGRRRTFFSAGPSLWGWPCCLFQGLCGEFLPPEVIHIRPPGLCLHSRRGARQMPQPGTVGWDAEVMCMSALAEEPSGSADHDVNEVRLVGRVGADPEEKV